MISTAYAMGAGGAGAAGQDGGLGFIVPLIPMFFIFWFLLIRPQQKQQKQLREMLAALKRGDKVITTGGVCGRITKLDERIVTLEIANNVHIKVMRSHIAGLDQPVEATKQDKK